MENKIATENANPTTKLPTLYKTNERGQILKLQCWCEGDTVFWIHGLINSKNIQSQRTYQGKNIGKSNDSSAYEEAIGIAHAKWEKYVDGGYYPFYDYESSLNYVRNFVM